METECSSTKVRSSETVRPLVATGQPNVVAVQYLLGSWVCGRTWEWYVKSFCESVDSVSKWTRWWRRWRPRSSWGRRLAPGEPGRSWRTCPCPSIGFQGCLGSNNFLWQEPGVLAEEQVSYESLWGGSVEDFCREPEEPQQSLESAVSQLHQWKCSEQVRAFDHGVVNTRANQYL